MKTLLIDYFFRKNSVYFFFDDFFFNQNYFQKKSWSPISIPNFLKIPKIALRKLSDQRAGYATQNTLKTYENDFFLEEASYTIAHTLDGIGTITAFYCFWHWFCRNWTKLMHGVHKPQARFTVAHKTIYSKWDISSAQGDQICYNVYNQKTEYCYLLRNQKCYKGTHTRVYVPCRPPAARPDWASSA